MKNTSKQFAIAGTIVLLVVTSIYVLWRHGPGAALKEGGGLAEILSKSLASGHGSFGTLEFYEGFLKQKFPYEVVRTNYFPGQFGVEEGLAKSNDVKLLVASGIRRPKIEMVSMDGHVIRIHISAHFPNASTEIIEGMNYETLQNAMAVVKHFDSTIGLTAENQFYHWFGEKLKGVSQTGAQSSNEVKNCLGFECVFSYRHGPSDLLSLDLVNHQLYEAILAAMPR